MASFLDLPTELRQIIIRHALSSRRKAPTPSKSKGAPVEDFEPVAERWQLGGCRVYYEQDEQVPTCLPLLLVNRQISTETKGVLNSMKIDYAVELSILNDLDIFPTWISIPCLTQNINHLRAEVRLFGHVLPTTVGRQQGGDGGRLGIHFAFHQVLQRFLMYGPVGERKEKGQINGYENKKISVRVLDLDVTSAENELPFPPDEFQWSDYLHQLRGHGKLEDCESRRVDDHTWAKWNFQPKYKTRPEWMSRWIRDWIERILGRDSYGKVYGKMIYENVGTLRVLADGKLLKEFDLSDCPEDAVARREELGFPLRFPKSN
ncbi:uncharacterized protein N7500_001321 [Penicillium coprophilum]|uniref:uncharacterized protein n=1 Tax=Penicillium coprophilum TaxID=36646 RepID=UPI00239D9FA7|nr:uncharacterized protein N7500_001321 [Penicillium coprophilum]KAJ5178622.1 hypothetical protein N7500_001321 [Penicillium coprophilum]